MSNSEVGTIVIEPMEGAKDKALSILQEAIGAGSMCWEDPSQAGVFQSEQALAVSDAALAALKKYFHLIPKGGNG